MISQFTRTRATSSLRLFVRQSTAGKRDLQSVAVFIGSLPARAIIDSSLVPKSSCSAWDRCFSTNGGANGMNIQWVNPDNVPPGEAIKSILRT